MFSRKTLIRDCHKNYRCFETICTYNLVMYKDVIIYNLLKYLIEFYTKHILFI
ncbi:hypothetical protein Mapa_010583 [Marchantia paleacea]|nr:hypothetical protein Mapa_010583 [Marchantia paleacea]